jgi:glycerophosphoryl diester phosphodiesterase
MLSGQVLAQPLLVSHKGIWKDHQFPQNTRASLLQALDNGFRGLEFDIFLTKDEQFVLAHDDKLNRVSNCKGHISQQDYAAIKECMITKNTLLPISQILVKKVKYPQRITKLSEVLVTLLTDVRLDFMWIDLKPKDEKVIAPMIELFYSIPDKKLMDKIVVNSTNIELLKKLRAVLPNLKYSLEGKWGSEPLTDYAKYFGGIGISHDYVSLNVGIYLGHEPWWKIIRRRRRFWNYLYRYLDEAKKRGVPTIGWTVNNRRKLHTLLQTDMEFLLTDRTTPYQKQ